MSQIKNLKSNRGYNINIIEMIEIMITDNKTKYVEMFSRLMDNEINYGSNTKENIINDMEERFPFLTDKLDELDTIHLIIFNAVFKQIGPDNIKLFNDFSVYNERKLIINNDLGTFKSFKDVENEVNMAEVKVISKEMEKQVLTVLSDEDWLIIRPLTYLSSKKYGSNTKWCTTSTNSSEHFIRYAKDGILIYCINKKTGYKVAVFKSLKGTETSFWDVLDTRIDSLDSELPGDVIILLRNHFKDVAKTNMSFLSKEDYEREMGLKQKENYKGHIILPRGRDLQLEVRNRYEEDVDEDEDAIAEAINEVIGEVTDDFDEVPYGDRRVTWPPPLGLEVGEERYDNPGNLDGPQEMRVARNNN